jgi:hypothetical protein
MTGNERVDTVIRSAKYPCWFPFSISLLCRIVFHMTATAGKRLCEEMTPPVILSDPL